MDDRSPNGETKPLNDTKIPLSRYLDALGPLCGECRLPRDRSTDLIPDGVSNDSRSAGPGSLFCAVRGSKADGHRFLPDLIARGNRLFCVAEDSTMEFPPDACVLRVRDSYHAWGILCEEAFGRPADAFRVHAITGTNGKTTTAFILNHFLQLCPGRKTALLSTVLCDTGAADRSVMESAGTMPDAERLQQLFCQMKTNAVTDLIMEASSHGLHQHRAGNLRFASGIFCNLTGDHLDYHKTMEQYYQAKKLLFSEMLREDAPALINIDDAWGKRLFEELRAENASRKLRLRTLSNSDPTADVLLREFQLGENTSTFHARILGNSMHFHSSFTGEHNLRNLLSALLIAAESGLPPERFEEAVATARPAPGRLESFVLKNGAHAFVDYAHTDDALLRVLSALERIRRRPGRILLLFGCGGDRDRTKRPRMGQVAAEHADLLILSSDNPRSEDPREILKEIAAGIPPSVVPLVIPERREAIAEAVKQSRKGDLILIAGKGHENYQEINGVKHHFDDREEIRRFC